MPPGNRNYYTSMSHPFPNSDRFHIIPSMAAWQVLLEREFQLAAEARSKKNEGQARVCARRAAGIAIRESLLRRGVHPPSISAYDLLNMLKEDTRLPSNIKQAADYLTLRVTEDFKLPIEVDLLAEARSLCKWLLPDWK